jgi:serine/threonine-protein kinase
MPLEKLGPYRLEKLLGRGGMGAVYAGVNETTEERAAVKVLAAHLADNPDFRERFTSEVETLKKLKHPNIVQLLAYGEEGEHLFYVMELVEGRSLQDELQSGRRFAWREVAKIGVDVCRALKHAHDNGVIHRDLKPANLLVDRFDQVKLTDFGIAKLYGSTGITVAGGILGTADYMSPEQAEGKPVTVRSDLYSLGSVLYALLAGRPPFASKSLAEVIHGLRFDKPVAVRRLAPDTPAEFESIILELLEKDPARRIPTAFAVGNFLRAMEHALSMETQVGTVTVDDLPLDQPASSATQVNGDFSATLVTAKPGAPVTAVNVDATLDLQSRAVADDYRLATPNLATASPGLGDDLHHQATAVEEPPIPRSRFVTVEEEEAERRQQEAREEDSPPLWLLLIGMAIVLCVLVGALVYLLTPPSADQLFAKIASAVEAGNTASATSEIDAFLVRFPDDPRAVEVEHYQETLDMQKLERQFELKARLGRADALSPVERAYLDAVRLAQTSPEKAIAHFAALIALFDDTEADSPQAERTRKLCVELAKKQVEHLRESITESAAEYQELITARLDSADQLHEASPTKARSIYQAVIDLYGDKPWAKELVERARQSLESPTH